MTNTNAQTGFDTQNVDDTSKEGMDPGAEPSTGDEGNAGDANKGE